MDLSVGKRLAAFLQKRANMMACRDDYEVPGQISLFDCETIEGGEL